MNDKESPNRNCVKPGCSCSAADHDDFCGEYCADAKDGGAEYACRCGHPPCD
jgi:hypothetical protein